MKSRNSFYITASIIIACSFSNNIFMNCHADTKKQKSMIVTSSAFEEEGTLPSKYTCDGENVSPPLSWTKGPDSTKSYALICDDPDAPSKTWVHWVLYNIPLSVTSLSEHLPVTDTILKSSLNGINDFKTLGYSGPCPPNGVHRYYFKIYALDCVLNLKVGETSESLITAMKNHILDSGTLMGKYGRK